MKGLGRFGEMAALLSLACALAAGCGDGGGGRGGGGSSGGPEITFFGVIRSDDTLLDPSGVTSQGVPIYTRVASAFGVASGFALVVEGMPGASGVPVGVSAYDMTLATFPDLVIQASRDLGNGNPQVCEDPVGMPPGGGVPGSAKPSYKETAENIARINDFACRFVDGAGQPVARQTSVDSCVNFNGDFRFVMPTTTVQFCGFINVPLGFPLGDTTVTARLRDTEGNLGPEKSIVIRVVP